MKRLYIFFAGLALVALVIGAGFWGFNNTQPTVATPPPPSTITAEKCTVQQTVTAPGVLVNTREVKLAMPVTEQLAEVLVQAGDKVQVGQALARLANAETYQAAVAAAELDVLQAQEDLEKLKANAPLEAAQAQTAVAEAQQKVNAAQQTYTALLSPDLAVYQRTLDRAQDALTNAQGDADLTELAAAVRQAEETVADMQSGVTDAVRLEAQYPGGYTEQVKQAQRALANAQTALDTARRRYQQAQISTTNTLEDAQAALEKAQRNLAAVQTPPNTTALALMKAKLATATAELAQATAKAERLSNGPDALALHLAETKLHVAQSKLAQAQANLSALTVTAPFDGVILQVEAQAGETVAANASLFTLNDATAVEVRASVLEEDWPLVSVGQSASVFFDAWPSEMLTGVISRMVPKRVEGDRPLYHIYLKLDQVPAPLVSGMNADASLVIAEKRDVLCLPRAVVRAAADGKATLEIWAKGRSEQRRVEVGLRGDSQVEILSGLQVGEQVVVK